jgi:hypothetical protein
MESTWGKPDSIINVMKHNIRVSNGLILRIQRIKIKLAVIVTLNAYPLIL